MTRVCIISGCKRLLFVVMVTAVMMSLMMSEPHAQEQVYAGKVVFEGQPVEGAEVYIILDHERDVTNHSIAELMSATDSDGTFSFSYQPDSVWVAGYLVAFCPGYSVGNVSLWKIDDIDDLTITLYKPSSISGVVRRVDGEPLEDAVVYLYGYEFGATRFLHTAVDMPGLLVRTDTGGRFRFDSIPEGSRVSFSAKKQGFVSDGYLKSAYAGTDSVVIYLDLVPSGSISGRVTMAETGEPVVGIAVVTDPYSGNNPARTDEEGAYELSNVRAGTYQIITASDDQYLGLCPKPFESVEVSIGERIENTDIEWVRGVIVTGMVSDMDTGEPLAGCSVSIRSSKYGSADYSYAETNNEGLFHATALPGRVYVSAQAYDDGYSTVVTEENRMSRIVTAEGFD